MIFDSKRHQAKEAEMHEVAVQDDPPVLVDEAEPAASLASRATMPSDETVIERTVPATTARRYDEPIAERDPAGSVAGRELERAEKIRAEESQNRGDRGDRGNRDDLEPLFQTDVATGFRRSWDTVQIGFVDDPRQAVQKADELVNQVLRNLSETFNGEHSRLEAKIAQTQSLSTEDLRVALRRYRALLQRLLAL